MYFLHVYLLSSIHKKVMWNTRRIIKSLTRTGCQRVVPRGPPELFSYSTHVCTFYSTQPWIRKIWTWKVSDCFYAEVDFHWKLCKSFTVYFRCMHLSFLFFYHESRIYVFVFITENMRNSYVNMRKHFLDEMVFWHKSLNVSDIKSILRSKSFTFWRVSVIRNKNNEIICQKSFSNIFSQPSAACEQIFSPYFARTINDFLPRGMRKSLTFEPRDWSSFDGTNNRN